jgi:hypothetical protein
MGCNCCQGNKSYASTKREKWGGESEHGRNEETYDNGSLGVHREVRGAALKTLKQESGATSGDEGKKL